jgi:hypothetical protein
LRSRARKDESGCLDAGSRAHGYSRRSFGCIDRDGRHLGRGYLDGSDLTVHGDFVEGEALGVD